ncbi:MAG: pseudouridine-5'-phosphate glycosidase, partial [Anaerolineae bacterium]
MTRPLLISASLREALHEEAPVVALESTVIAHGLPYPTNLETARRMEEIVREQGAHPATI